MYAEIDFRPLPVFEGTTPTYEFQIVNHRGEPVPLSALDTVTLFYYDVSTLTVLNTRQGQNIKNANNVAITAGGLLTWDLQAADTTRVTGITGLATHEATFIFTYDDSGTSRCAIHKARWFITDASLVAAAP